ncbi:MAG: TerB family tellurite resistance protein [Runella sp.]
MNNSPNLYIGLGSAVYALVKTDGNLHSPESLRARMLLIEQPHGDLAMQSFIVREHYDVSPEEAYNFALRCFKSNKNELDADAKKSLVSVIKRVAEADKHISKKESEFIKRFQRDLRKL